MGLKTLAMCLTAAFSCFSFAADDYIYHFDCNVWMNNSHKQKYIDFYEPLGERLKRSGYTLKTNDDKTPVGPGNFYLSLEREMINIEGKIYPDCQMKVLIKKTEKSKPKPRTDKTVFANKAKRSFPRLTIEGTSRCIRAVKDALWNLPSCKVAGGKK